MTQEHVTLGTKILSLKKGLRNKSLTKPYYTYAIVYVISRFPQLSINDVPDLQLWVMFF